MDIRLLSNFPGLFHIPVDSLSHLSEACQAGDIPTLKNQFVKYWNITQDSVGHLSLTSGRVVGIR